MTTVCFIIVPLGRKVASPIPSLLRAFLQTVRPYGSSYLQTLTYLRKHRRYPASSIPLAAMSKPYAIKPIPGKGKGIVALTKIPRGTRLLDEEPLFKHAHEQIAGHDEVVAKALRNVTRDQQRAFFSLHNAYGKEHCGPLLGIVRTNALQLAQLGYDAKESGLFLECALFNHDCRPNAYASWNTRIGRQTIHATRDIEAGEEITISYLGEFFLQSVERQERLGALFLFTCCCKHCSLPLPQRTASDFVLAELDHIDQLIESVQHELEKVKLENGLHLVHRMVFLSKVEGMVENGLTYSYANDFAAAHGDVERARYFAREEWLAMQACYGEDAELVVKLAQQLQSQEKAERQPDLEEGRGRTIPSEEDEGFLSWLWMEGDWSADYGAHGVEDRFGLTHPEFLGNLIERQ